jgi:phage tail-like protein
MMSTGVPLGLSWLPSAAGNWVPGVRPLEPFVTFNFAVEVEGLLVGGFSEVSGLESEIEMDDHREGGVNDFVHKLPRQTTYNPLQLRHGLTAISSLWNWYHDVSRGVIQRKNGTIMLLDPQQIPVMWWNFRNALPVRWTGPTFDASNDQVGFESLELVHEGLTKPLLGQAAALAHGIAGMAGH